VSYGPGNMVTVSLALLISLHTVKLFPSVHRKLQLILHEF